MALTANPKQACCICYALMPSDHDVQQQNIAHSFYNGEQRLTDGGVEEKTSWCVHQCDVYLQDNVVSD